MGRRATPPATKKNARPVTSKNVQQATRKGVPPATSRNVQRLTRPVTRNPARQPMRRFVHRVVTAATTNAMLSATLRREQLDGATATLLQESRLASGCRSSRARASPCRSLSRNVSRCQRRAVPKCQCKNQPRWRSRSALEVQLEVMEDTGDKRTFLHLLLSRSLCEIHLYQAK